MRLFAVSGTCLALFFSACGSLSVPAGIYVHASSDIVAVPQIPDVRHGRVDATLSAVVLEADGKLSGSRPVAGTLLDGVLNLVRDNGGVRTWVTGVIDGETAELSFFRDGTPQTLAFEKQSVRSFSEPSAKLQSSAVARVQSNAIAGSKRQRAAGTVPLQVQIGNIASGLSAQASGAADGAARSRGTSAEHIAATFKIKRRIAIAKEIKLGAHEADAKLQQTDSETLYVKRGRRQANFRAQSFFDRALGMVSAAPMWLNLRDIA